MTTRAQRPGTRATQAGSLGYVAVSFSTRIFVVETRMVASP
jgi:hypothetical protein